MKSPIVRVLTASLVLALAGCRAPYPKPIEVDEETTGYPSSVAGFTRSSAYSRPPDDRDIDLNYHLCGNTGAGYLDISVQIGVFRVQGPRDTVDARFEAAKPLTFDPDSPPELLQETVLKLTKNGRNYEARKASYKAIGHSLCGPVGGPLIASIIFPVLPRYLEVIVWRHEDQIFRFISFAEPKIREAASRKNLELLDAIDWTKPL